MNQHEHIVERWTGRSLKLGVWLSGGLMAIGLIAAFVQPVTPLAPGGPVTLLSLIANVYAGRFDPVTVMFLGLVLLMFTPFLRVFMAIIGFAMEKDWRFVGVAIAVFCMLVGELLYSLYK